MPNLIVRNVEPELVEALTQRAARNGRSAEMEHHVSLREVLLATKKRTLAEALMAMSTVDQDSDFERVQNTQPLPDALTCYRGKYPQLLPPFHVILHF